MPDDKMPDIWMLYSTFPNRGEALSVADSLLEKRLIACGNVIDQVISVYRWEGKTHQEPESILIAKTTREKAQAAIAAIKELHSYRLPCVIAYPVTAGLPAFLQWVADGVK